MEQCIVRLSKMIFKSTFVCLNLASADRSLQPKLTIVVFGNYINISMKCCNLYLSQNEDGGFKLKLNVPTTRHKQFSKVLAEIKDRTMPSS